MPEATVRVVSADADLGGSALAFLDNAQEALAALVVSGMPNSTVSLQFLFTMPPAVLAAPLVASAPVAILPCGCAVVPASQLRRCCRPAQLLTFVAASGCESLPISELQLERGTVSAPV